MITPIIMIACGLFTLDYLNKPNKIKKYVVLEHLTGFNKGRKFWSTNTLNNTHSNKGELWYKEVLFTDFTEEAIKACRI